MIQEGSTVLMHYALTVDGSVVDTSAGGEPLEFVQGSGHIISGLEREVSALAQGDKKRIVVSPEAGYGISLPELVQKVPAAAFKDVKGLSVGAVVRGEGQGGAFQARVTAVGETEVTLDLNHPLAGKTLDFEIEIVKIVPPPSPLLQP